MKIAILVLLILACFSDIDVEFNDKIKLRVVPIITTILFIIFAFVRC